MSEMKFLQISYLKELLQAHTTSDHPEHLIRPSPICMKFGLYASCFRDHVPLKFRLFRGKRVPAKIQIPISPKLLGTF